MKLGDLLNTLASKCGLQNESSLIDLLSSQDIAQSDRLRRCLAWNSQAPILVIPSGYWDSNPRLGTL